MVSSGAFEISVTEPDIETCMSCHGVEDYHHVTELDCVTCHIGEEGTENFKVNKAACTTCHPREGIQGRRLIQGSAEMSPPYTVHVAGRADDDTCLACHDNEQHQKGEVLLIEPRTLYTVPWTESQARFCLGCHGGKPPAGVSFPATEGSGFDKSAFLQSKIFAEGMTCSDCHAIHGSPLPDLLKEKDLASPH
jgi:predicted CXXCH cytochrome family protein